MNAPDFNGSKHRAAKDDAILFAAGCVAALVFLVCAISLGLSWVGR